MITPQINGKVVLVVYFKDVYQMLHVRNILCEIRQNYGTLVVKRKIR